MIRPKAISLGEILNDSAGVLDRGMWTWDGQELGSSLKGLFSMVERG